jgi:hypothetical protein
VSKVVSFISLFILAFFQDMASKSEVRLLHRGKEEVGMGKARYHFIMYYFYFVSYVMYQSRGDHYFQVPVSGPQFQDLLLSRP